MKNTYDKECEACFFEITGDHAIDDKGKLFCNVCAPYIDNTSPVQEDRT
jgi:hypothetical protein